LLYATGALALPNAVVFSYPVTSGEILVGVTLILELLTGFAAFLVGL
jgi:thiosulfate dehydrogenase (quinone) large subunit